ncbi:MAG: ankyrin repeat domain-containing protein [Candidatus Cardinium sp.]|uniref:ankyrin repeat domain-containing protein n=1 Tax=Candidatus Cardinium sp. TP TaxID=2961955 RepID=UPI0021B0604B|nr:ankyrin repeat domain-containing protein [Candidatus Cardinium sp. TP]MCT4697426.1 ankyrin repeat domain-containing protein [Candidatus Cardinium sp. TP]MDN5247315.1 ankyrin repeat domain-containing protein [Candidatus Cardinium sp.]
MQPLSFFYFSTKALQIIFFWGVLASGGFYAHAASVATEAAGTSQRATVYTELIWAIQENNLQKVSALLFNRKNINNQDFLGYSPLHYAVKHAKAAIVDRLIEAKVLLDQVSVKNGNTPLLLAVERGHRKVVSLLLAAGANPNVTNHQGYTALQIAIKKNKKYLVQLLLQAGAMCGTEPSPLCMAIQARSLPIVQLLLQQKQMAETKDKKGYTALHRVAFQNEVKIFRALLKSGSFNINAKAANGATPLHLIAANKKSKLLKTLLRCPLLEINAQDCTGNTPLHYAVATQQRKAVDHLLRYPAIDVNIENNIGQTSLHYAVQCQNVPIVKKLLIHAPKGIWIKNKESLTPLELAMHQNNTKLYKLILVHVSLLGAD